MDTNDIANPTPSNETMTFEADVNGPAVLPVEDVFFVKGRGSVATGTVSSGSFHSGQLVTVQTALGPVESRIVSIETFHEHKDSVSAGEAAGLVFSDIENGLITKGSKIVAKE